MIKIILDTETTGLSDRDRLVDIACLEVKNCLPTGRFFQTYLNPQISISSEAQAIHGLSSSFLQDKPLFQEISDEFKDFIGDKTLVIHNAAFDIKFINRELKNIGQPPLENAVIDTLDIAKKSFPGSPVSLDALCNRFKIDRSRREKHGALLDCELLALVYLELMGGRQQGLGLEKVLQDNAEKATDLIDYVNTRPFREDRFFKVSQEEKELHIEFMKSLRL